MDTLTLGNYVFLALLLVFTARLVQVHLTERRVR